MALKSSRLNGGATSRFSDWRLESRASGDVRKASVEERRASTVAKGALEKGALIVSSAFQALQSRASGTLRKVRQVPNDATKPSSTVKARASWRESVAVKSEADARFQSNHVEDNPWLRFWEHRMLSVKARNLRRLTAGVTQEQLEKIDRFASHLFGKISKPTFYSKKAAGLSHSVAVMPGGDYYIHGGRNDPKYDPEKRGSTKLFRRAFRVQRGGRVDEKADLKVKDVKWNKKNGYLRTGLVGRVIREDRRAARFSSKYIIKQSEAALVYNPKGVDRLHLLQPMASMDGLALASSSLSAGERAKGLRDAALGLAHLHDKGFMHRDIKPANILINTSKDGTRVKRGLIADLGLAVNAKWYAAIWPSRKGWGGSPHYLSREVRKERRPAMPSDDLYAFGLTIEEIMDPVRSQLSRKQKGRLDALVRNLKGKDPVGVSRPSARAVAERLSQIFVLDPPA